MSKQTFLTLLMLGAQMFGVQGGAYLPDQRPEGKNKPLAGCGGKPADIVFILDSSSSIWGPDFDKQLEFVQDMIGTFQVGPDHTRVGVSMFSDHVHLIFRLSDYDNAEDAQTALYYTRQRWGGTNTGGALRHMRHRMFSKKYGSRGGDVPRIAVVITDGKSQEPKKTALEAVLVHKEKINVFALGVGSKIDKKELERIASDPDDQFVFTVDNYDALASIKEMLAMKACKVDAPTTPMPADQPCGWRTPADIVFALGSDNSDTDNRKQAMKFFHDIIEDMEVGDQNIKVGMVPKDCSSLEGFDIDAFTTKNDTKKGLDDNKAKPRKSGAALEYMRKKSFTEESGCRSDSKRIAVVILDGSTQDIDKIADEARMLREEQNVELYAIGVGKQIDEAVLRLIASDPPMQHMFQAGNYNDLHLHVRDKFMDTMCLGL